VGEPQHLFDLSHGQLSPGRHPILLVSRIGMPRLLTRGDAPWPISPTDWPASSRNGGRHQIGTLAGFASEQVAGFRRNPQVIETNKRIAETSLRIAEEAARVIQAQANRRSAA